MQAHETQSKMINREINSVKPTSIAYDLNNVESKQALLTLATTLAQDEATPSGNKSPILQAYLIYKQLLLYPAEIELIQAFEDSIIALDERGKMHDWKDTDNHSIRRAKQHYLIHHVISDIKHENQRPNLKATAFIGLLTRLIKQVTQEKLDNRFAGAHYLAKALPHLLTPDLLNKDSKLTKLIKTIFQSQETAGAHSQILTALVCDSEKTRLPMVKLLLILSKEDQGLFKETSVCGDLWFILDNTHTSKAPNLGRQLMQAILARPPLKLERSPLETAIHQALNLPVLPEETPEAENKDQHADNSENTNPKHNAQEGQALQSQIANPLKREPRSQQCLKPITPIPPPPTWKEVAAIYEASQTDISTRTPRTDQQTESPTQQDQSYSSPQAAAKPPNTDTQFSTPPPPSSEIKSTQDASNSDPDVPSLQTKDNTAKSTNSRSGSTLILILGLIGILYCIIELTTPLPLLFTLAVATHAVWPFVLIGAIGLLSVVGFFYGLLGLCASGAESKGENDPLLNPPGSRGDHSPTSAFSPLSANPPVLHNPENQNFGKKTVGDEDKTTKPEPT